MMPTPSLPKPPKTSMGNLKRQFFQKPTNYLSFRLLGNVGFFWGEVNDVAYDSDDCVILYLFFEDNTVFAQVLEKHVLYICIYIYILES